jgi:hypothetical protein
MKSTRKCPIHVGDEVFAPDVEAGQDCSCDECDQDVGPAFGPMGDGEDDRCPDSGSYELLGSLYTILCYHYSRQAPLSSVGTVLEQKESR